MRYSLKMKVFMDIYVIIYPVSSASMPEVHCMAQLARASDQTSEDPGLSLAWLNLNLSFFSTNKNVSKNKQN